jgi:hypothetical protein
VAGEPKIRAISVPRREILKRLDSGELEIAIDALVFWDITNSVRTSSNKDKSEYPNSYTQTGPIVRVIQAEEGMYIDQIVGGLKKTLFTNLFKLEEDRHHEDMLRNAATAPPRGNKSLKIDWNHEEQNLFLQPSQELKMQREAMVR